LGDEATALHVIEIVKRILLDEKKKDFIINFFSDSTLQIVYKKAAKHNSKDFFFRETNHLCECKHSARNFFDGNIYVGGALVDEETLITVTYTLSLKRKRRPSLICDHPKMDLARSIFKSFEYALICVGAKVFFRKDLDRPTKTFPPISPKSTAFGQVLEEIVCQALEDVIPGFFKGSDRKEFSYSPDVRTDNGYEFEIKCRKVESSKEGFSVPINVLSTEAKYLAQKGGVLRRVLRT
jgi:hypothetical protein